MIYILLCLALLSLLIFLKFFFNPKPGDVKIISRLPLDQKHSVVSVVWKNKEYLLLLSSNSSSVIDQCEYDESALSQKVVNITSKEEKSYVPDKKLI